MASVKAQIKAIGDAVKRNQFDDAIEQAYVLFQRDPKNYLGYELLQLMISPPGRADSPSHIFLGFSLEKKNQLDDAEKAYHNATAIQPEGPQAWQGLIKLYERQGARKLAAHKDAVLKLGGLYAASNEHQKCRELMEKYLDFAKENGDSRKYVDALSLMTPDSPLYEALEGLVPRAAATYETMATILEADEKKRINTLIGERRTRIGARLSEVTTEVKLEVLGKSQLSHIYRQLINWTSDDELRRATEEKLLRHCYDRLIVTPAGPEKSTQRDIVTKLANDMVIIKHPFKFAWDIAIDWKDHKDIAEWDVNILREYCAFFPDSDVYKVITGFLTSPISPFPQAKPAKPQLAGDITEDDETDSSEEDSDGGAPTSVVPVTDEDRLLMMTDGMATANSLLAYRLMGEYYQYLEEHESAVELMRKAITHLKEERTKSGLAFENVGSSFSLYLGTSLVFYQSPRHHEEAMSLFNSVLSHDPVSTPAMIGVGLIFEEEEEYPKAADFLTRALERDSSNLRVRTEAAWVKALGGDNAAAKEELESCIPLLEKKRASKSDKELLALAQYRLGCCIWNIDSSRAARKSRKGAYAHFLAALKNNLNLAPAYTSLGKFYGDYAKDKKRARRCFQKAVELSSSEVEAAEELARSFADDGDWDRVEVVARRVVESGKVKPPPGSKRKGISWPHSALGVALMNKLEYREAIVSFQAALRTSPEDYHSWVGLGESYYSSGRYMAATKAILHAQGLEASATDVSGDVWFTKYMLANVKRELGEYEEAVALYREVHESRPNEEGVILALMQTMVDNSLDCITKGFFGTAVDLARGVIDFATTTTAHVSSSFNYWKALGDACGVFSAVRSRIEDFPVSSVQKLLQENGVDKRGDVLADVDKIQPDLTVVKSMFSDDEPSGLTTTKCAYATTLCYKLAIDVSSTDIHAQAVAYYNLGWAEYRVHCSLPPQSTKKSSRWIRAAVRAFKRAIELEHSNAEFWNALGVVTSRVNPAVSQHALVRSLHLDERSPATWTNLATLALLQNDPKLANDAFTRAQSNDPDYPYAWLGQGFVALLHGDAKEARGLFTHAMEISESSAVPVRHQYAASVFDNVIASPSVGIMDLIQPIYALSQAQAMYPRDLAYRHLRTLFQERIHVRNKTVGVLEDVCSRLEAVYEATESPEALGRFALAKVDLARAYLAEEMFDAAVECGDMALGLTSDESEHELSGAQRNKGRLSAHLTVGIAQYFKGDVPGSITYFEAALEESDGDPDAVCLLAQVLWAAGTDESKEKAREVLFGVIEAAPDHVPSVLLLGVVALLDEDEESLDAVVSELHALRTSDKVQDAERARIGAVLKCIRTLPEERTEEDVLTEMQTDVMLHPYQPHGWGSLAEASGEAYPAEMAVRVAVDGTPPRGTLEAGDLAKAYAGTGKAADAQTGVFIAPWAGEGWEALGEAVACLGG